MIVKILVLIVLLYLIWLFCKFIILVAKNGVVINTFKKLDALMKKRYDAIDKLIKTSDVYDKSVFSAAQRYLQELISLPNDIKLINRKLNLNYLLTQEIKKYLSQESLTDEYKIINSELSALGDVYNKRVDKLKRAVEIFPTSIMARFLRIKTVDWYRY